MYRIGLLQLVQLLLRDREARLCLLGPDLQV